MHAKVSQLPLRPFPTPQTRSRNNGRSPRVRPSQYVHGLEQASASERMERAQRRHVELVFLCECGVRQRRRRRAATATAPLPPPTPPVAAPAPALREPRSNSLRSGVRAFGRRVLASRILIQRVCVCLSSCVCLIYESVFITVDTPQTNRVRSQNNEKNT